MPLPGSAVTVMAMSMRPRRFIKRERRYARLYHLARESPHRRWGQKSVGHDTFAGITLVSARTRCVRSSLASAALASNASFNPSTAVAPQRVVSFINVVGCGTTPSSGIDQQHVDPREFLRQPQHLIRQQRLSQRLLIAYRTKDDGLDPF